MKLRASVIISFYNKIEWLSLVLAALERQTLADFEVIIADDGSRNDVVEQIKQTQANIKLKLEHIWHPDKGFMKAAILNKAVVAAKSDYLIFIDGDCIPHKDFVHDHVRLQKSNQLLAGRRVNLSKYLSEKINEEEIGEGQLEGPFFFRLVWDSMINRSAHAEKGLCIKSEFINRTFGTFKKGLLGSNFSVSKKDILDINGFDERYQHPTVGEDTDIEYRLKKNGIKIFSPKFCIVQYHLWHNRLSRELESVNLEIFRDTQKKNYIRTPFGIQKLSH